MPPPVKTIRAPLLPKHLEPRALVKLAAGDSIEQCRLDACALADSAAEKVRFDGVRLVGGTLGASKLTQLAWIDVACERCDLSMITWPGAKLTRVEVRGSRMTGAKCIEGQLESVRFVECHLDYATFTGTRFRQVTFESCRLEEADFGGAESHRHLVRRLRAPGRRLRSRETTGRRRELVALRRYPDRRGRRTRAHRQSRAGRGAGEDLGLVVKDG